MYLNPKINNGYNGYTDLEHDNYHTGMEVGLLILQSGDEYINKEVDTEVAYLILSGDAIVEVNKGTDSSIEGVLKRKNEFEDEASCVHVCNGSRTVIRAIGRTEIYVQRVQNKSKFNNLIYMPQDVQIQNAGNNGELRGCMRRDIKTIFDYDNAPYSNMVLGEVLNYPGKWSSYPPHHHPQPEVYFYRFDKPQGFGAGFANGNIYKVGHNGLLVINHSFHSQVAAPGYAMCYIWGIRHLKGEPWIKTRIDDKEHEWLWKSDANDYIMEGGN